MSSGDAEDDDESDDDKDNNDDKDDDKNKNLKLSVDLLAEKKYDSLCDNFKSRDASETIKSSDASAPKKYDNGDDVDADRLAVENCG